MQKRVILDTDIGGDTDDTFALLLALNSPEIKLELVVTSDEHMGHRAKFAKMLVKNLGSDTKVVSGSDLGSKKLCLVCDIVKDESDELDFNYLEAIADVVKKNDRTYYVCISPQTNLSAFLDYAPELSSKLDIIIMGGTFNHDKEHNIAYDPRPALRVFNSNIRKLYVLKDITKNRSLEIGRNHRIMKLMESYDSPAARLVLESMNNWFTKVHPSSYMHDPLTLSYLIDEDLVKFASESVIMDKNGRMKISDKGKFVELSKAADYDVFMSMLYARMPFRRKIKGRS
jgi:inosine-uridine nucleoside N-ribohydrolase